MLLRCSRALLALQFAEMSQKLFWRAPEERCRRSRATTVIECGRAHASYDPVDYLRLSSIPLSPRRPFIVPPLALRRGFRGAVEEDVRPGRR